MLTSAFFYTAKLRNILSQSESTQGLKKQLHGQNAASSVMAGNGSFLPPLFALSFGQNFRDRDLSDDKGSSLLLGNHLGSKNSPFSLPSALASSINSSLTSAMVSSGFCDPKAKSSISTKAGEPPPAHQNLSTRSKQPVDTLDLRFTKSSPSSHSVVPPIPAHKPLPPPSKPASKSSSSPAPVLDLSSGPAVKKDRDASKSKQANQPSKLSPPSAIPKGKAGKRISKIDDLAFTLRQKKMMLEKHDDPHSKDSEMASPPPRELKPRSELDKVETRSSASLPRDHTRTPPAAHSSSMSSSLSPALMGAPGNVKMSDKPGLFTPKGMPNTKDSGPSLSSLHHLGIDLGKLAQSKFDMNLAETAALKKFLEEHPDILTNPNFAANAALALNSGSSIPANVSFQHNFNLCNVH